MTITKLKKAPITPEQRKQLQQDAKDIWAAAARKGFSLDEWDARSETHFAKCQFELGCWLYYYSTRIYAADGLADRIDCLRRIFEAGFTQLNYEFFTIFDFGERQFDTLIEMGDADKVIAGVRQYIHKPPSAAQYNVKAACEYMGWWPLVV